MEELNMLKDRERFMTNAGDLVFEVEETQQEERADIASPATTENTPFLSIFCC